MNEQATLYFEKMEQVTIIGKGSNIGAKIGVNKSKEKPLTAKNKIKKICNGIIYRTYSEMELLDLQQINETFNRNEALMYIDL